MRRLLPVLGLLTLLGLSGPASAFELTPIDADRVSVETTAYGQTRDAAVQTAIRDAVRGSAGRVLMDNKLILADELLAKYLDNYANKFVEAVEVLGDRFDSGQRRVDARIYLNYAHLVRDMDEKKFLYVPAYKPRFATFMTERLEGQVPDEGVARESLTTALNALGLRPYEAELASPPGTTDVAADELLLRAAIVSAQRSGVEIIVSGEVKTTLRQRSKLYFDEYWFYDTEMSARLVRVDTGEILFSAKASGSASDRDPSSAIRAAIERASSRVSEQLVLDFEDFWPEVVQGKSDYQVLLTGVDSETLRIVAQNLERMGRDTRVDIRKRFDRSAVITVRHGGPKSEVIENLNSCPYPTLRIVNPDSDRVFEVQVSG